MDDIIQKLAHKVCEYIIHKEQEGNIINLVGIKVPAASLYQKTEEVCGLMAIVHLHAQDIFEREGYKKKFIVIPIGITSEADLFNLEGGTHDGIPLEPIKKVANEAEVKQFKQQLDSCKTITDLFKFMGIKPEEKKDKEDKE